MLGVSASKISRIETGNSGLQLDDVAALLGFYQVPEAKRQELLDLLRRGDQKGWWERQAGLPHLWRALIDFENKATRIHNYEYAIIPGLLQTSEYSEALIRATDPTLSEAELDNLVASRMARQTLLTRTKAPAFRAVIHEMALRVPAGAPGVMKRQLQQLTTMAERPNVEIVEYGEVIDGLDAEESGRLLPDGVHPTDRTAGEIWERYLGPLVDHALST